MSRDDLIRGWKDPDSRDSSDVEHPSGEIRLVRDDGVGGTGIECTISLASLATYGLSCLPTCEHTVAQGSCAWFTYACCSH